MKGLVYAALALLGISVGLGIWSGIAGSAHNTALVIVHKLASVGFAVLGVIWYIRQARSGMAALDPVAAILLAALLIALFATGGIMSGKELPAVLLRIVHTGAAILLTLGGGWKLVAFLLG